MQRGTAQHLRGWLAGWASSTARTPSSAARVPAVLPGAARFHAGSKAGQHGQGKEQGQGEHCCDRVTHCYCDNLGFSRKMSNVLPPLKPWVPPHPAPPPAYPTATLPPPPPPQLVPASLPSSAGLPLLLFPAPSSASGDQGLAPSPESEGDEPFGDRPQPRHNTPSPENMKLRSVRTKRGDLLAMTIFEASLLSKEGLPPCTSQVLHLGIKLFG